MGPRRLMWHVGINTPVVKFILNVFVPSDGSKSCESRKRGQHFHGVCYPGQPNEQRLCFGHQSSYIPAWKATRNQILHGTVPLSFLHYPQGYQRLTTHAEWLVKTVVWIGVVSGVIMHKAFAARFMMPRRLGAKKGCLLWHCRSPCGQIHFIALRKSRVTYYNGIYLYLIPVNRSLYRPFCRFVAADYHLRLWYLAHPYLKSADWRMQSMQFIQIAGSHYDTPMGHSELPQGSVSKARLSAMLLLWKGFVIPMKRKLIFTRKVLH